MRKLLAVLCVYALAVSFAFSAPMYPFHSAQKRQQFQRLTSQLRCLVCQNESIAASFAPLAGDLRKDVYKMVKAGKTDSQIKDYLVKRYGDFVLFDPPLNAATVVLWAAPFVLLLLGGGIAFFVIREHSRGR